ncbi:MAG: hypothetical protein ACE5F5_05310 [Acidimicrobiia bacterium]
MTISNWGLVGAIKAVRLAAVEVTPDSLGPSVDVALLADAVQAVQGKLFVLGGGWDTLWVRDFPARHPSLAIGLRLRVPVSWGKETLKLSVELQDADGGPVLPHPLSHDVRLPPSHQQPPGASDFGLIRSFTFNNLVFTGSGPYSFVISVDDEPVSRLRFTVRRRPDASRPPE